MNAARSNENHHYVPQAYLRHWCGPDGKMWIYPLDGRPPFRASPKNFAVEKGLYDTSAVPHLTGFDHEGDLSKLEGLFDSRWPEIFDGIGRPATKMNLSRYLALTHLRHPRQKEEVRKVNAIFRQMAAAVADKEEFVVRGVDGERLTIRSADVAAYASDTPENANAGFLGVMRWSVEDLANILNARKWGVLFNENGGAVFVTGDCPLVLHRGTCIKEKYGFGTPGTVITFPISPSKMLRIADDFAEDGLHYHRSMPPLQRRSRNRICRTIGADMAGL